MISVPNPAGPATETTVEPLSDSQDRDFSLVLGGPIFQFYRKSHLSGPYLELLKRRLTIIPVIAWLPLLTLTILQSPSRGLGPISFFRDVEAQVRFLIALPLLIASEVIVHQRLGLLLGYFLKRGLIRPHDVPAFTRAVQSAKRLRDSVPAEGLLIVSVYTIGLWFWHERELPGVSTWYSRTAGHWDLTPAGIWYVFVSIPIFQIVLVRWYFRLFIWFRLLWQIARMDLHLVPIHPDRCGGIGFLGRTAYQFGPILFAQGALVAGVIGNRVLNGKDTLLANEAQVIGSLVFFLVIILGPLLMFTPTMMQAKRRGLAEYGTFGATYVRDFEHKWIGRRRLERTSPLGSGDIQSLADLSNSYAVVREMRITPFSTREIINLTAITAAPLTPLLLTVIPAAELISRAIKILL